VGFAVAGWQLRRTATAAEAARRAAMSAAVHYGRSAVLAAIPELLSIDLALATTAKNASTELLALLARWRHSAAQAVGALGTVESLGEDVSSLLRDSIGLAAAAETALQGRSGGAALAEARSAVAKASARAAELAEELKAYT